MLIKICGITTVDIARATEQAGANMIGFVFARSSRQVTPEQAAIIVNELSHNIKKVGVFVNETRDTIEYVAEKVGLDFIQLHGDESAEFAYSLSKPVIKAFTIDDVTDDVLQTYPCEYYLIDSPGTTYRGGSGNVFDWERLFERDIDRKKLILAGGLNETNVAEAIQSVSPAGIDVSSGVETSGMKDIEKINRFIQVARNTSHTGQ